MTDKGGRPVSGLKAADFAVKIGGKSVAIENFYERRTLPADAEAPARPRIRPRRPRPRPRRCPPAPAPAPRPLPGSPFLWDKWKSDAAFDALRNVLHGMVVEPGDDAMIVTWDRAIGAVVPFTSGPRAPSTASSGGERLSGSGAAGAHRPDSGRTSRSGPRGLRRGRGMGGTNPASSRASGADVSQRAAQAEAYATMRDKASGAESGLRRGRRDAGPQDPRPREPSFLASRRARILRKPPRRAGIQRDGDGGVRRRGRERERRHDVHGLPGGVEREPPGAPVVGLSDAGVLNEAAALEILAEKTGGTFALGWREAPALAHRIVADVDSSYSLGVASPGGKTGKSLAVKVSVRNPALTVRARRAALERTAEERVEARVLSNLFRPEPASRLNVSLDSASVEPAKKKATATLRVRVPIGGLVKTPSTRGESGAFSVFVVSAAADGAFTEVVRQRRPFEIPKADVEKAEAGHFTYEVPVVVGLGEARISVGVWDEVGKEAGFLLVEVRDGGPSCGADSTVLLSRGSRRWHASCSTRIHEAGFRPLRRCARVPRGRPSPGSSRPSARCGIRRDVDPRDRRDRQRQGRKARHGP